jgi:ATP-dependent DNA helicase RecG
VPGTAPPRQKAGPPPPLAPADPPATLAAPVGASGLRSVMAIRKALAKLGLSTVRDLLFHLPRRYDDLREMRQLGDLTWLEEGTVVSARVRVVDVRVEASFRRRIQRTIAVLEDDTGTIESTWFGRRYIERRLHAGDRVIVSGKLKRFGRKLTLDNPDFQPEGNDDELLHVGRIVPVYRLTAGLTANRLRIAMRDALDGAGRAYPEYLPVAIRDGENLVAIANALEEAHYPASFEGRDAALRRLAFDELLALQLGMVGRRRQRGRDAARPIAIDDTTDAALQAALIESLSRRHDRDVALTVDQAAAIADIRSDLARPTPMLRLLQGDVGSGKTAVAAYALAAAARAGLQAAILAPTDLLARQHHKTLSSLMEAAGIPVELLTGSLSAAALRQTLDLIASGMAPVVVGTHALIQERVSFAALGLVVIDEQHRFGVEQRGQLEAKAGGHAPHVLLMTATPIPRTLGQVLYADLDVSDLRTAPEGRIPIRTGIRRPDDLRPTWDRVRAEAGAGHRTFVVVPLIDEADPDAADGELFADSSAVAAEAEAVRLRALLAPLRVGLVHGRTKAADRDAEMARFRDGELDVLVGTTVVEVGVDVPEATMMIVEGADRFGLAQLHQLRGRVGRGRAESFCVLVSDSTDAVARARLEAVAATRDGFELAEADFRLRREGDVLGFAQSGFPRLRVASLQQEDHRVLAATARRHAERLLDADGRLHGTAPEDIAALERELREGWLARVAAGEGGETASAA